jgi:outer membrane protein assembly factor BamB
VSAEGVSYAGTSGPVYTGSDGRTCIEIKRGDTANIFVGRSGTVASDPVTVTGTAAQSVCGVSTCSEVTLVMADPICTPGAYQACPYSGPAGTQGQGICQAGRQQCNIFGTEWKACEGEVTPKDESCTSPFDDDCDGAVNETCSCSAQEGQPCYSGAPATQGVGICHAGKVGCDLFGRVTCVGQQLPRPETCSTLEDDDCDGVTSCTPVGLWTKDLGAAGNEEARSLAVDREGNAVLLGRPDGSFPIGDTVITGDTTDLFVSKFSPAGQPLWSRLIERDGFNAGNWNDGNARVITDGAGNVLIAGSFKSALRIGGLTLTTSTGYSSGFVIKLSPTGNVIWAQGFDGRLGGAWATGLATTPNGDLIVTGAFQNVIRIGDTEYAGNVAFGNDLFVVRLDGSTGTPLWNRRHGGELAEFPDVSVDAAQNVWVTGTFANQLNLGEVVLSTVGLQTPFIAKLDGVTGATLWAKNMNSPRFYGRRVHVDAAGNVLLLTWRDQGSDGMAQATLLKLNASGGQLWSRTIPQTGPWIDPQMSLAVDAEGRVLLSGWYVAPAPYFLYAFLDWYGPTGDLLMTRRFGDPNPSAPAPAHGRGAGFDSDGNVLFAGDFSGTLDFGSGPVQAEGSDIFLLKIDPTP